MRQQATRKLPEEMDGSEDDQQDIAAVTMLTEATPPLTSATPDTADDTPQEPAPPLSFAATDLPTAKESANMNAEAKLGSLLSQARKEHGISIDEAAERLYLEPRIIAALEKERYAELPPVIFVQGYLRSYARLLNLPIDTVLNAYYQSTDQKPPKLTSETKAQRHIGNNSMNESPRHTRRWWNGMTLLLALILIGLVAWRYAGNLSLPHLPVATPTAEDPQADTNLVELPPQSQPLTPAISDTMPLLPPSDNSQGEYTPPSESISESTSESTSEAIENDAQANGTNGETLAAAAENPAAQAATAEAEASATDTETTANPTTDKATSTVFSVAFNDESWVSIVDGNGKRLVYGTAKDGDTHRIEQAETPIKVVIGRPAAVTRISFRGEPIDLSTYRGIARFTLE